MKKKSRINKYLSEVGFCSRRQADKLITSGRVFFNGKQAILGDKVSIFDEVLVDNKKITPAIKDKIYIAFNKPLGVVCTTDKKREKNNIIDYINYPHRIFPIGRLDKNSEGLIFLTNDGDIVNKILRSKNNHQKEYDVKVDKPITKKFIQEMQMGVPILDTLTKKCVLKQTGKKTFNIVLTQGLNRQIRRMCEHFGYSVKHLKRVRIMNIKLDTSRGKYRHITKSELKEMKIMLSSSTKTHSEEK